MPIKAILQSKKLLAHPCSAIHKNIRSILDEWGNEGINGLSLSLSSGGNLRQPVDFLQKPHPEIDDGERNRDQRRQRQRRMGSEEAGVTECTSFLKC